MRILMLLLLALTLDAQAPLGNARLKFGINSSQRVSRVWLGDTGASWAMADENLGELVPVYGGLPSFTLVGTSSSTCGGVKCALDFSGLGTDYIYISDSAATSPTTTLTITTIAKIDTQTNHTLISKWGAGSNAFSMFFGEGTASNLAQCFLVQSDTTTITTNGGTYTPNVWEAWTCVADGSTWRMYKNGLLAGTPQSYNGTIQDSTQSMVVGSLGVGVTFFLDGKVAYADYRKVQMSASQVRQHYKALRNTLCNTFPQTGAGTFCTDLPK